MLAIPSWKALSYAKSHHNHRALFKVNADTQTAGTRSLTGKKPTYVKCALTIQFRGTGNEKIKCTSITAHRGYSCLLFCPFCFWQWINADEAISWDIFDENRSKFSINTLDVTETKTENLFLNTILCVTSLFLLYKRTIWITGALGDLLHPPSPQHPVIRDAAGMVRPVLMSRWRIWQ